MLPTIPDKPPELDLTIANCLEKRKTRIEIAVNLHLQTQVLDFDLH